MNSWILLLVGIFYSVFSNFPVEILFSAISMAMFFSYAQKSNIPFSIQFYFGLFFLQIVAVLFFLDFANDELILRKFNFEVISELEVITIIHLIFAIVSFCFTFNNKLRIRNDLLMNGISKINFTKLVSFYLAMSFLFPVLSAGIGSNASLRQFFLALSCLKDVALILFVFYLFLLKTKKFLILGILLFEFVAGFVSYFSSFKTVIIYVIIVLFTTKNVIAARSFRLILPIVFFAVYIMSFWSYVKSDYRTLLRNGEVGQSINVETDVAADYILEEIGNFNLDKFYVGISNFFGRAQYLEEYHTVVQNVPSSISHQDGKLTLEAIAFALTPRFLNANKSKLDPSKKTAKYTGRDVATADMGTSISLGFFVDFYIDYGFLGMLIPLIVLFMGLGLFFKRIYTNTKYHPIFNLCMLIAIVVNIGTFESDIIYFIGILRNYIFVYFFSDIFIFKNLNKYLMGSIILK